MRGFKTHGGAFPSFPPCWCWRGSLIRRRYRGRTAPFTSVERSRTPSSRHGGKTAATSGTDRMGEYRERDRGDCPLGLPGGDVDRFGSRLRAARPHRRRHRCLPRPQRVTAQRTGCGATQRRFSTLLRRHSVGREVVQHRLRLRRLRRQMREHPAPVLDCDLQLVALRETLFSS